MPWKRAMRNWVRQRRVGKQQARALTLMEVLIVVAIILLLIGILAPILATARRHGRKSDTLHQLSSLRSACEGYFQIFQSYPGPIPEFRLVQDMGFTGSHNLTLGTVGTLYRDSSAATTPKILTKAWGDLPLPPMPGAAYEVYAAETPLGIYDVRAQAWHAAFYPIRGRELQKASFASATELPATPLPNTNTKEHSKIPVLHDRYSSPLPVLYFRRDPAVQTPVVSNSTSDASGAYYRLSNKPYLDSASLQSPDGSVWSQSTSGYNTGNFTVGVPAGFGNNLEYTLTDMTAETGDLSKRRTRGGFVLISAGEDRVYGPVIKDGKKASDADDVVVFGGH